MKKLLNLLSTATLVVLLGLPVAAMVAFAILVPSAHTVIGALIALLVCGIALVVYRGVSAGKKRAQASSSEA